MYFLQRLFRKLTLISAGNFTASLPCFSCCMPWAFPIWAVLGITAAGMLSIASTLEPGAIIGEELFAALNKVPLTAIPLFILTGDVLVRTGISRKF